MQGKLLVNEQPFQVETKRVGSHIVVNLDGKELTPIVETTEHGYRIYVGEDTVLLPFPEEEREAARFAKPFQITANDTPFTIQFQGERQNTNTSANLDAGAMDQDGNNITAFMPGTIVRILVEEGQQVQTGDVLLILEAMKMENEIKANFDARVTAIQAKAGSPVNKGQLLIQLEPAEDSDD